MRFFLAKTEQYLDSVWTQEADPACKNVPVIIRLFGAGLTQEEKAS